MQATLLLALFCAETLAFLSPVVVHHAPSPEMWISPRLTSWTRLLATNVPTRFHVVDGIECREVTIDLQIVGPVTILEATAKSQEDLVDMALALDEELSDNDGPNRLQAGDPYGAVLWPAASAVSNYLLTKCAPLEGITIVEVGTGTGLVSLAVSLGGAAKVTATDYESIPLRLIEYAQANLNKGSTTIETEHFDLCDFNMPLPPADLVVAADVMYEPRTGTAMAKRTYEALSRGSRVVVGDSPGRAGRPAFLEELKRLGVKGEFTDTVGQTCSGPRHDLICGKDSSSVSDHPKDLTVAILDLDPTATLP
ncbi:hypothetical protein MHU86_22853 [Fragilaria crotonensis]|nr:hypothetical protein MHU86_22853 [Fragilaria crotonensis]